MGVGGVGGNSGAGNNNGGSNGVSGGKSDKSSEAGKGGTSCSTSVNNNEKTATTTAEKTCTTTGVEAHNVKTGIDKTGFTAEKLSRSLTDSKPISQQKDTLTAPNLSLKEALSTPNTATATKFSKDNVSNLKTDKFSKLAPESYTAKPGEHYGVKSGIQVTAKVEDKMNDLANKVYEQTKHEITYSSAYRGPKRQAEAMYDNIMNKGLSDFDKYKQKDLAQEVKDAYLANVENKDAAIAAMRDAIQVQVDRGQFISSHLRSNAVDVSRVDKDYYDTIRDVVTEMGGTSLNEGDHLHVQF
jgi:hypothetical protein